MRGKVRDVIALILLVLPVAGCSAAVLDGARDDAGFSISGQAPASVTSGSGAATLENGSAAFASLPFVRSSPEVVAPFPLVLNETVQHYVDSYLSQPQGLESSFRRSNPYMAEMVSVLQNHGLPKDLVYLTFAESAFTDTGAGPWQLSRETARRFGLTINRWVDERRDPIKSTRAAAAYLATLHDEVGDDWRMTLVAWNNGEGGVDRYRDLQDVSYELLVRRLPERTRELLNRFMAVALIARHSREYGMQEAAGTTVRDYRVIPVKGGTQLSTIAEVNHTSVWMLHFLNPGLLRDAVPPAESYAVRVPSEGRDGQLLKTL
jgi:membrane-bound lytic murein transglycosylase D